MKKVIFLILSLIACFSIYAQNGGEFYYYKGERCYLNTSNDSALVYFNKNLPRANVLCPYQSVTPKAAPQSICSFCPVDTMSYNWFPQIECSTRSPW